MDKSITIGLIFFYSVSTSTLLKNTWVIWNVGQGQTLSYITKEECFHYDTGGERLDFFSVSKICEKRKNILYYSHWDWDHVSFVNFFSQRLNACVSIKPKGETSFKRWQYLSTTPTCKVIGPLREILWSISTKKPKPNEWSRVFWNSKMLVPGDSTKSQEKLWANPKINSKILIVGHHGSRTSTSKDMLSKLPNVKMAIVSSRRKRYGHPHKRVLERLKNFRISVISTEDWGNIHLQE